MATAFQGVEKESIGYRLITGMGWREGEGLGLKRNGIKQHLRAKRVIDRQGIGLDRRESRDKAWEKNCLVFEKVLNRLTEIKASEIYAKNNLTSKDKKQKIKRKKKLKQTHQKRYLKQKNAKLVKSYSEADLAAILGQSMNETQSETPAADTESDSEQTISASDQQQWWSGIFVRAGTLDSIRHENKKSLIKSYTESDQVALCKQSQENSSKSRTGLGKRRELKIAGGAVNQGKRVVFEDSDDGIHTKPTLTEFQCLKDSNYATKNAPASKKTKIAKRLKNSKKNRDKVLQIDKRIKAS